MNILGVGPWELILVAVLALIFIGPEKLPELMRQIGRTVGELRRMSSALTAEFKEELAPLQEVSDELTLVPKKEEKRGDGKTQQPAAATKVAPSPAPTAAPEGLPSSQRSVTEALAAGGEEQMAASPTATSAFAGKAVAEPAKVTPEAAVTATGVSVTGEAQPALAEEASSIATTPEAAVEAIQERPPAEAVAASSGFSDTVVTRDAPAASQEPAAAEAATEADSSEPETDSSAATPDQPLSTTVG